MNRKPGGMGRADRGDLDEQVPPAEGCEDVVETASESLAAPVAADQKDERQKHAVRNRVDREEVGQPRSSARRLVHDQVPASIPLRATGAGAPQLLPPFTGCGKRDDLREEISDSELVEPAGRVVRRLPVGPAEGEKPDAGEELAPREPPSRESIFDLREVGRRMRMKDEGVGDGRLRAGAHRFI